MRLPPSLGTRMLLPLLRWFYLVFAAQAAVYTFAAWWMRIPYAQVAGVLLSTVIFALAWRHTCYMQSCLTRWARRPGHRPDLVTGLPHGARTANPTSARQ